MKLFTRMKSLELTSYKGHLKPHTIMFGWATERRLSKFRKKRNIDVSKCQLSDEQMDKQIKEHKLA